MPTLPNYSSQRNITANPVAPQETGAEQPYINQREVINTVADIADKWQQTQDVMQETKVKSDYEIGSEQIYAESITDPDINNAAKYKTKLDKLKESTINGISNGMLRNRVSLELDHSANITNIKIQSNFAKKQLLQNAVAIESLVNTNAMKRSNTNSESQEAVELDANMRQDINKQVLSGAISPSHGEKLWDNYNQGVAYNDMFKDPTSVINELSKQDGGKYKNIDDPKKRATIRTAAIEFKNKQEKEIKAQRKEAQYQLQTQFALDLSDGKPINLQMLDNGVANGTIEPDFADAVRKAYLSYDDINVDGKTAFIAQTKAIFSSKSKDVIQNSIYNILKEKANGNISVDDMAILVNAAIKQGELVVANEKTDSSQAVNSLDKWSDETKGINKSNVFRDFVNNIIGGKSSQEASQSAMKDNIVKDIPDVVTLPPKGKLKIDKYGNKAIVFPDGHFEEVK